MRKDSIIDELHEIRRDHARKFGHDLHKIFADLKERSGTKKRKKISGSAGQTKGNGDL